MENMDTALVVLVTGLVVVFAVLILLTAIIKIYGTIVSKAQNKTAQAKPSKAAEKTAPKAAVTAAVPAAPGLGACRRSWNSRRSSGRHCRRCCQRF